MDRNSLPEATMSALSRYALIASWCLLILPLQACGTMTSKSSSAPAMQAQTTAAPRPVPPSHASALVGDGPDAVQAALGPPVLRHNEGPAEVWLYATADGCRLDLVLYHDGGGAHVAHADTRTPSHMSETACLHTIADQNS
jgi:hypothetical protein